MKEWKWPLIGFAIAFGLPWTHHYMAANIHAAIPGCDEHLVAILISIGVGGGVLMTRGLS
jgi:hypothetical protein